MNLHDKETITGEQRKACVKPPDDIWELLPQGEIDKAARKAQTSSWSDLIWNLLKPAYGLKDAPLLWIMILCNFIKEIVIKHAGENLMWLGSLFDEGTFYVPFILRISQILY